MINTYIIHDIAGELAARLSEVEKVPDSSPGPDIFTLNFSIVINMIL